MSFDPVPWFIGGGAEHSPEVARQFAYMATSGTAGIGGVGDLRVTQTPIAGTSVRIAVGGGIIPSLYPGATQQTYIMRAITETDIAIAPTGAGGGRVDMVIARVNDPQYSGQSPTDVRFGPYDYPEIIENVSATATALPAGTLYPAIPLARINIPANTTTITAAMITDLRKVARPRRERHIDAIFPSTAVTVKSSGFVNLGQTAPIAVPAWATQMKLRADYSGLALLTSNAYGTLRPVFAGTIVGQATIYDENYYAAGGYSRSSYLAAMELAIPANIRGTSQILYFQANRTAGTGWIQADTGTTLFGDLEFLEVAE